MKYVGNIVTNEPASVQDIGKLYKIVSSIDDTEKDIPTLIIGWELTKCLYPEASIIEFVVAENVYWTYGKYERRDRFEDNLKKFREISLKKYIESISYSFYDVMLCGPEKFESFLASLKLDSPKTIYCTNDMLYLNYSGDKRVIGVSLRDCDYINDSYKKKLFSAIYSNDKINYLKGGEDITREIKYVLRGKEYIVSYVFS